MTVSISSIKKTATLTLKGNWVKAIITALIPVYSVLIVQNIAWVFSTVLGDITASIILGVLSVLISWPSFMGALRYFWRMFNKMDDSTVSAFYYFMSFKNYTKCLKFAFILLVRCALFGFVFYFPAIVVNVVSSAKLYDFFEMPIPLWSQNLTYLVNFLTSLASVLLIIFTFKYYLAPILMIMDDNMDIDEAVHMSVVISKTSLLDFLFLILNLFVIIVLSVFVVPLVFTLPYLLTCYCVHSFNAVNDYNEKIKVLNGNDFSTFMAGV